MFRSSSESSIEHGNFPSVINLYAAGQKTSTGTAASTQTWSSGDSQHYSSVPSQTQTRSEETPSFGPGQAPDQYTTIIHTPSGTVYFGKDREGSCGSPPSSDSDSEDEIYNGARVRRNSTTSTSTSSSSIEHTPKRRRVARGKDWSSAVPAASAHAGPTYAAMPGPVARTLMAAGHTVVHNPLVHVGAAGMNIVGSPSPSSNTVSSGHSSGGHQPGLIARHQPAGVTVTHCPVTGRIETSLSHAMHSQGADSGISNTSPETQSSTEFHQRTLDVETGSGYSAMAPAPAPSAPSGPGLVPPQSILKHPRDAQTPNQMAAAFKTALFSMVSAMYALLLVVLGCVLPASELLVKEIPVHVFEGFYVYLYTLSIMFLVYVYVFLLRTERERLHRRHTCSQDAFTMSMLGKGPGQAAAAPARKRRVLLDQTEGHTGSFYLRLGSVGFGLASMIRDGLQFGRVLEHGNRFIDCTNVMLAVRPMLSLIFTFIQLYFIFLNSKMCIHKYKVLARFGLMHMIATNLCVWLRVVIKEALMDLPNAAAAAITATPTPPPLLLNRSAAQRRGYQDQHQSSLPNR